MQPQISDAVGRIPLQHHFLSFAGELILHKAQLAFVTECRQVNFINAVLEIGNPVIRCHGGVLTAAVNERITPGAAGQRIHTGTAVQHVIARAALQYVVGAVAYQNIVAGTANGVFDGHAVRDRHVTFQAAHIRQRPFIQVDALVVAVTGKVEGVVTARIPYRENQRLAAVGRGIEITVGIGMETVYRIAGTGGHVGAVQPLNRRDVINHRRTAIVTVVVGAGFILTPVAHNAELVAIFSIHGVVIRRVPFPGVVFTRMRQAERMANFVGKCLTAIFFRPRIPDVRLVIVVPAAACALIISRIISISLRAIIQVAIRITRIVTKGDIGGLISRYFGKCQIGYVRPGLQRQFRLLNLLCVKFHKAGIAGWN